MIAHITKVILTFHQQFLIPEMGLSISQQLIKHIQNAIIALAMPYCVNKRIQQCEDVLMIIINVLMTHTVFFRPNHRETL